MYSAGIPARTRRSTRASTSAWGRTELFLILTVLLTFDKLANASISFSLLFPVMTRLHTSVSASSPRRTLQPRIFCENQIPSRGSVREIREAGGGVPVRLAEVSDTEGNGFELRQFVGLPAVLRLSYWKRTGRFSCSCLRLTRRG